MHFSSRRGCGCFSQSLCLRYNSFAKITRRGDAKKIRPSLKVFAFASITRARCTEVGSCPIPSITAPSFSVIRISRINARKQLINNAKTQKKNLSGITLHVLRASFLFPDGGSDAGARELEIRSAECIAKKLNAQLNATFGVPRAHFRVCCALASSAVYIVSSVKLGLHFGSILGSSCSFSRPTKQPPN